MSRIPGVIASRHSDGNFLDSREAASSGQEGRRAWRVATLSKERQFFALLKQKSGIFSLWRPFLASEKEGHVKCSELT
jgi:hypothetical protein